MTRAAPRLAWALGVVALTVACGPVYWTFSELDAGPEASAGRPAWDAAADADTPSDSSISADMPDAIGHRPRDGSTVPEASNPAFDGGGCNPRDPTSCGYYLTCDPATATCVGCTQDVPCPDQHKVCVANQCVFECASLSDCGGSALQCLNGHCVQCMPSNVSKCSKYEPLCNAAGQCVCRDSGDCGQGETCTPYGCIFLPLSPSPPFSFDAATFTHDG